MYEKFKITQVLIKHFRDASDEFFDLLVRQPKKPLLINKESNNKRKEMLKGDACSTFIDGSLLP